MKRICAVSLVVVIVATAAWAQGPVGLMVSETAAPKAPGAKMIAGGVTIGDDSDFFGGRFSAGVFENLLLFGDVGILNSDDIDESDPGIQIGGIYSVPVDLPVDLAARGAYATVFFDDYDYYSLSAMALASKDLEVEAHPLSVYGGIGLLYWEVEADVTVPIVVGQQDGTGVPGVTRVHAKDDDTEIVVVAGAILDITEQLSVYVEYNHVDDSFFGGGVRWAL